MSSDYEGQESAPTVADQSAATLNLPPSVPMYLAALIVTGCGLFAATQYLGDDPFTRLIFGLTTLGFIVSFVSRQQNVSPRNIELPALIICGCVFFTGLVSDQPFLAPASIGDDRHRSLAVLLTWLTVFRSYTLINDGALLFCCVPTIALIGLISTNMTDESLLTTFIVFVAAAAFMMVHENFLRTRAVARPSARPRKPQPAMMGSQLQVAGVCVAASVFLANIVTVPLRNILTQVQVTAGIPTIAKPTSSSTTITPQRITEDGEVRIGNGPVTQSGQIVMRIQTDLDEPYWRGTTFDEYTGHGWKNTFGGSKPLRPAVESAREDGAVLRDGAPDARAFTFEIPESALSRVGGAHRMANQHVQLVGATFDTAYAAAEPRTLTFSARQGTYDDAGTIHLGNTYSSIEYDIRSDVSTSGPADLRNANGDDPEEIRQAYLQLPANVDMVNRWKQAAAQATAGARTRFDRVDALSRWIGTQCKYNLKADAVPDGEDVVDTFLFKQHQGYCDSFATALAMLCRTLGIPARVASGFLTGEHDLLKKEYVVRERDKHQWTEVYFGGIGWVKFDATDTAENITPEDDAKSSGTRSLMAFLFGRGWLPPIALIAFIAMLIYVIKVEVWNRLRGRRRAVSGLALPDTNLAVVDQYDGACRSLARIGLRKHDWETATEFERRAVRTLRSWDEATGPFERLTALMINARYSGLTALDEDVRLAREAAAAVAAALRAANRKDVAMALAAAESTA